MSQQSLKASMPDSNQTASSLKQSNFESSTATQKQHSRKVATLTGSGMTKVATFVTKTNILSKQIHESMARCSPRRENMKPVTPMGAAGLMKSHNLGTKMGLLTKSVSSTKLSLLPFRNRENTLRTGPSSPMNQTTKVSKALAEIARSKNDENKTPAMIFEEDFEREEPS
mmetsp:Transcript_9203/g.11204  ORF Transcript_9203/g.11204 Transcript_9203/m.11204 type:complete len:170 (+) Transcript_9203:89-598(+)